MLKFYTPEEYKKGASQKGASSNSKSKITFYTPDEYKQKQIDPVSHSIISNTPIETKRNRFTPEEIKNINNPVIIEPKKPTGINRVIEGAKGIFKTESPVKTAVKKAAVTIAKSQETPTNPNVINQVSDIGGYKFGTNIMPVKKDDNILQKAGKSVVNFATGIPGAALNVLASPDEGLRQAAIRTDAVIEGKKQPAFKKTSFLNDIALSEKGQKAFEEYKVMHPNIATVAEMLAEIGASPTTWLGGGGIISEANKEKSIAGTTKGLIKEASTNEAIINKLKNNIKLTAEETKIVADNPSLIDSIRKDLGITDEGFTRKVNPIDDKQNSLISGIRNDLGIQNKGEIKVTPNNPQDITRPNINNAKENIQLGDAVWKNKDYDQPIKVTGDYGIGKDGKRYVKIEGSSMGVPLDEIQYSGQTTNPLRNDSKQSNIISSNKGIPSQDGNKYAAANMESEAAATMEIPVTKGKDISREPITKDTILPEPTSKITSSSKKQPFNFKDALNKFYTRTVDTARPFTSIDKNTYIAATNSKSTSGIVDYVLQEGLVNKSGEKVADSLKKTVEDIPKGKEEDFWTYMSQRHNIDRAREGKPVQSNYTPEMSTEAVRRIESINPEFKKVGDNITGWIDKFMRTWGVDTGIVDAAKYDELRNMYKSYFPTQRDFSELEKSVSGGTGSKKFVDLSSPIKKAKGSERDIINPVENIMNLVNRTVRTAKYNEVGKGLLDAVRKSPEKLSNLAEVIPTQEGMFANTDNVVSILENGKPTYLRINNSPLLDALNNINKTNVGDIEKVAKKATGIFKALVTQKNPVFAIRNISRDIPTYLVNGSENNPIKALGNLGSAAKDILTNGKDIQRYKGVGGGGANFFNSGNVAKSANELTGNINPVKKVFKGIGNGIEKFNNLTETAPRLAEFKKVLKDTGDTNKALYAANDVTTNFSRGGDITKKADSVIPYLNAGVQGLDKLVRQVATKPLQTLVKGAIAITAPTIIMDKINSGNPNYQELDQRTKDNYFLFPNPTDGGKTFIKIPKSRELGVLFSTLEQRIARAFNGDKEAFKGFGQTFSTNFAPANPLQNNIISPIKNLDSNKDFAGRKIVPESMLMDNRSPYLQYDEKTSEIGKAIGKLANISPKQVDYIIKSYTGVLGQMGLPATTNNGGTTSQKALNPITSQFIADPVYSNQTLTDFYNNLSYLKRKAADKNILGNIPSNVVTPEEEIKNKFNKASLQISDINKQIRALDQVKDNQKIRDLRQKINDIAKYTNSMLK